VNHDLVVFRLLTSSSWFLPTSEPRCKLDGAGSILLSQRLTTHTAHCVRSTRLFYTERRLIANSYCAITTATFIRARRIPADRRRVQFQPIGRGSR